MSIFRIDGRIVGEDEWVSGGTKFTTENRAAEYMRVLVKAFREHGRWPMEFKITVVEGDLLDSLAPRGWDVAGGPVDCAAVDTLIERS